MDRPIIAILKPDMSADFGWDDKDFGDLGFYTQMAAAFSFLFTGWLVDRLGVRRSMIGGVTAWSLAAMAHGWAITTWHVVAARVGLGATEAVQTPLTIKTVATLFEPVWGRHGDRQHRHDFVAVLHPAAGHDLWLARCADFWRGGRVHLARRMAGAGARDYV
ncbi:MAG: MFS transporter [Sphingomonadales bacterium]|nr:MFS transporter [Sphingomonadales bacterium]